MNAGAWSVIVLLILINALYVAAEFGAVGVRRGPIRHLASKGHRLARGVLPILEDTRELDRYIAGCQIGITLSSLVLGAFGQATLTVDYARVLQGWTGMGETAAISTMATAVLIALTGAQVVFGELVPKSLALQFPVQMTLWTYLPMKWSLAAYSWFIAVMNGSGLFVVRLLGFPPGAGHRHIHSPEEIEMLVIESGNGGLLEPEERERLRRALRLGRRTARELMVPRQQITMIDIETPPDEVLRIITSSQFTRLPVYRKTKDDVAGFLHTRDVARCLAEEKQLVLEKLIKPLPAVPSQLEVERLLPLLQKRGNRMALVLDEFGGVEGIVTFQDVLGEVLGDPVGDFPSDHHRSETLPDGYLPMPGAIRLHKASAALGVHWRHADVITLGGYVTAQFGRMPAAGEDITLDGLHIIVERVENRAIASLLIGTANVPVQQNEQKEN